MDESETISASTQCFDARPQRLREATKETLLRGSHAQARLPASPEGHGTEHRLEVPAVAPQWEGRLPRRGVEMELGSDFAEHGKAREAIGVVRFLAGKELHQHTMARFGHAGMPKVLDVFAVETGNRRGGEERRVSAQGLNPRQLAE